MRYYYRKPYYHRHHIFTGIVTIVLIMVLALIGLGAYQTKSFPFNVGSSSSNSPQTSKPVNNSTERANSSQNSTQNSNFKNFKLHHQNQTNHDNMKANQQTFNTIGTFWKRINNILGSNYGSNTSLAPLFAGGNSNNSYHGIKNWLRFVTKANANNDTSVISIKPYDAKATNNVSTVVYYRVRYDFRLHDHSNQAYDHIQIYNWTATFNHMFQIQHMSSPIKPAKDYTN